MKLQPDVRREVVHIAIGTGVLFALLNMIFLLCGKWDWTVLLGSLMGSVWAIANFLLLGLTIQKAASYEDQKRAKSLIQFSYSMRLLGTGLVLLLGFVVPCFHWLAVLPTALFQRITILFMQITGITKRDAAKEEQTDG